jgi:hypothetical protein
MLRRQIGENIGLATVLAREAPPVWVHPGQIEQALLNPRWN